MKNEKALFDSVAELWNGDVSETFFALTQQGVKASKTQVKKIIDSKEFKILLESRAVKSAPSTDSSDDSGVASPIEVKRFWTAVMRSDDQNMLHRLRASEMLAKMYGMLTEKHEISGDMKFSISDILDADLKPKVENGSNNSSKS